MLTQIDILISLKDLDSQIIQGNENTVLLESEGKSIVSEAASQ